MRYHRICSIKKGAQYLLITCEIKALQGYKFTFIYDVMMNRELNFSMTKNEFGHVLICWWVIMFLEVSY